jgi:glycolate oxidase FAD binding subunit
MPPPAAFSLEDAATHLASIAGREHTSVCDNAIDVAPAGALEIGEILRFAASSGLAVTPVGGETKSGWGNPVAAQIRLSLKRMHAVREHSWQDMTCTIEAGCTWADLQTHLRQHGQTVALDPLWPERATVGGVAAVNESGALRLRYGGLRDLILGMTLVLADGTVAKTGGKVVKNVAGYDLHKLMTGSFGTLAVIADVNFRLHPVEESVRTWSASGQSAAQFEAPLRALLDTQIGPSCVQLRVDGDLCTLDVRASAVPGCLDEHALALSRIFAPIELREAGEEVWDARQELFDGNSDLVAKISTLPGAMCTVIDELQRSAQAEGLGFRAVAQAHGLAAVALHGGPDAVVATVKRLRTRLHASGGSATVLRVPEAWRGRLDVWDEVGSALPLMREIKKRFDPPGILNPGRFVGKI